MLGLGAPEIGLIILAIVLFFGYKKLPDASRSLGRSLRIFKGEMKGMKDDDVRAKDEATTVHREIATPPVVAPALDFEAEARAAEARAAEARAAEARARADSARTGSATPVDGTR